MLKSPKWKNFPRLKRAFLEGSFSCLHQACRVLHSRHEEHHRVCQSKMPSVHRGSILHMLYKSYPLHRQAASFSWCVQGATSPPARPPLLVLSGPSTTRIRLSTFTRDALTPPAASLAASRDVSCCIWRCLVTSTCAVWTS